MSQRLSPNRARFSYRSTARIGRLHWQRHRALYVSYKMATFASRGGSEAVKGRRACAITHQATAMTSRYRRATCNTGCACRHIRQGSISKDASAAANVIRAEEWQC